MHSKLAIIFIITFTSANQETEAIENALALFILRHTDLFIVGFCLFIISGLFLVASIKKLSNRLRDIRIIVKGAKEAKSFLNHESLNKENIN